MGRIMKILGIITVVTLLVSGGAMVPVAATPEVTVSIDAPPQAAPGSTFTANVNISEVVDFDACNYDVSFDASVLELTSVTSGLIDSTTIPVSALNEISSGTWRVVQNVEGTVGVSSSGYLAVLNFHVTGAEDDSSTISLSNGILGDNTATEIPATWVGDSVRMAATAAEDTTPPTVASSAAEDTTPPTVVDSAPETTTPPTVASSAAEDTTPPTVADSPPESGASDKASLPTTPINWPVLWGVIGGVVVIGVIVLLQALRRSH
ncbi:hypothetical protein ES703_85449 [subsurface metagenome]